MSDWTEKNPIEPKRTRRELHDLPALPSLGGSAPTWCDRVLSVEEFKALLRDFLHAYAKAIPHPIGSGPEAIALGEAAVKAQIRVVEAFAFARRQASRATLPSEGARP